MDMDTLKTISSFYNIPPEVVSDIAFFAVEVERFKKGETTPERFKPTRVTRGIYAQRGQTTFMVRIKAPAGGLLPHQMRRIAELSERYGNGIPHVTARQGMQIHWVKIDDIIACIEGLAEVGLSTRGGGGNTVRNITACPDAGVCANEVFDVAPYAIALTEFFLGHPKAFTLPRKYKIAFSGCSMDGSLATVNDVGFIAKKKVVDGREVEGFAVYAAGGMGAYSRVASLLEDFVPAGEAVHVAEAMMHVFDKHGNRRNKHKARLRFVIDKYGYDEFKRLYKEELDRVRAEGAKRLDIRPVVMPREVVPSGSGRAFYEIGIDTPGFYEWFRSNVRPHRQKGFYHARIRVPLGDMPAEKLRALADMVQDMGDGTVRTTHDQNIMVRWLVEEELVRLFMGLNELGLADRGAGAVDDVLCCPGASTCNLGICLSRNMARELIRGLGESPLPLDEIKGVDIKISGCPNACGQHPIAAIGLHGAARRVGGRLVPHYEVLLGGRVEEGRTKLASLYGFVPAKNAPAFIRDFLSRYAAERVEGEDFHSYLDRKGADGLKSMIGAFSSVPPYEQDSSAYTDWGADAEFSLAGLGPGECGAGIFDMMESDMDEARRHLKLAGELLGKGADASEELYRATALGARALLITRGIEPSSDMEAFDSFEKAFVETGLVSPDYRGLKKKAAGFLSGLLDEAGQKAGLSFIEGLIKEVGALYEGMDDALNFKKKEAALKKEVQEGAAEQARGQTGDAFMDLRGVKCPINYVKAKIRLEAMEAGQRLLLYLDEGEPVRNVPVSLKNDGQEILRLEKIGEHYELLIKKAV